jgi:hypothetical protein
MGFLHLLKQIRLVPEAIMEAGRQRQLRVIEQEHETERLDRIRHPEKYRGK